MIKKLNLISKEKLKSLFAQLVLFIINGILINIVTLSLIDMPFTVLNILGLGILHYFIMEELTYFINKCRGAQ